MEKTKGELERNELKNEHQLHQQWHLTTNTSNSKQQQHVSPSKRQILSMWRTENTRSHTSPPRRLIHIFFYCVLYTIFTRHSCGAHTQHTRIDNPLNWKDKQKSVNLFIFIFVFFIFAVRCRCFLCALCSYASAKRIFEKMPTCAMGMYEFRCSQKSSHRQMFGNGTRGRERGTRRRHAWFVFGLALAHASRQWLCQW